MNRISIYLASLLWLIVSQPYLAHGLESLENTSIWRRANTLLILDMQGNLLDEINLPLTDGEEIPSHAASHDGQFIAYMTLNTNLQTAQLNVLDILNTELLIEYDLPYHNDFELWRFSLDQFRNFNLDNSNFAYAYHIPSDESWELLIFDLLTGEVTASLAQPTDMTVYELYGLSGTRPLIYRFVENTVTFVTLRSQDLPVNPENESFETLDWDFVSGEFAHNCLYTHRTQATLDSTGEIIEADFDWFQQIRVPDADNPDYGYYLLQQVPSDDTLSNLRHIVFQSTEPFIQLNFIQNGEQIGALTGMPETRQFKLHIIGRDGAVVDQFEISGGTPSFIGTNDGLLYSTFNDQTGSLTEIRYINTREATQTVIWQSDLDIFLRPVWADLYSNEPVDFVAWEYRASIETSDCPVNHG